jgi:alpha/beta superfamily hydrolase
MRAPSHTEQLSIPGPAGVLEAVLEHPAQAVDPSGAVRIAVVCHPHPQHQGTMHNKVVHTLARAALGLGAPALRFNFRGVGKSAGAFDDGLGETDDALAAIGWLLARQPGAELWLMGFSFGAMVALRAAAVRAPAKLVTVAPAVGRFRADQPPPPAVPWLVVQGEADELVDVDAVQDWAERQDPRPELVVFPGVAHFFHGHLHELRDAVVGFLGRT